MENRLYKYFKKINDRCLTVRQTITKEGYPKVQDVEVLLEMTERLLDYYVDSKGHDPYWAFDLIPKDLK